MKKLFSKEAVCILSPKFHKAVIETANIWAKLPYNIKHARKAWYWKFPFIKINGYILTGFKTDWQPKSGEMDMLDILQQSPIEMVFVTKDMYERIKNIKSNACTVEAESYGTVKTSQNDCGTIPVFCLFISSFIKELDEKEISKLKAIDALIAGIKSF